MDAGNIYYVPALCKTFTIKYRKNLLNVTGNHFVSYSLHLNDESSSFEIAAERSFHNREFVFARVDIVDTWSPFSLE